MNSDHPTSGDYAHSAARAAQHEARSNAQRIKVLEGKMEQVFAILHEIDDILTKVTEGQ